MKEKLIINVNTWLHREGAGVSSLLRTKDGKRCCLGIYLQDNCGISPSHLRGVSSPDLTRVPLDTLPPWLLERREEDQAFNSPLVEKLMSVNDERESLEEATRAEIKQLFAQANIDVEYVEED